MHGWQPVGGVGRPLQCNHRVQARCAGGQCQRVWLLRLGGWRLHGGAIPSRFDDAACCHMTSMLCTALATAHSVPDATCSAPGPCSRRAAHVSGLLGQHDLVAGGCRMLLTSTPHARMYSRREDPTHITPPAPCPCRSQAAPFVAACNGSVGACSPACAEQLAPFNQRCFHSVLSEQFFQFGPAAQPPSVEAVHAFYSTCFPATGGPAAGGVAPRVAASAVNADATIGAVGAGVTSGAALPHHGGLGLLAAAAVSAALLLAEMGW